MMFPGHRICSNAFCYFKGIGKDRLIILTAYYNLHGVITRDFHYKGRTKKAITYEEAKNIVDFLKNVADLHALDLLGRVSG